MSETKDTKAPETKTTSDEPEVAPYVQPDVPEDDVPPEAFVRDLTEEEQAAVAAEEARAQAELDTQAEANAPDEPEVRKADAGAKPSTPPSSATEKSKNA